MKGAWKKKGGLDYVKERGKVKMMNIKKEKRKRATKGEIHELNSEEKGRGQERQK